MQVESTKRRSVVEPGLARMVFNLYEIVQGEDGTKMLKEQPDFTLIFYRWYVEPIQIDEAEAMSTIPHAKFRRSAPLPTTTNVANKALVIVY